MIQIIHLNQEKPQHINNYQASDTYDLIWASEGEMDFRLDGTQRILTRQTLIVRRVGAKLTIIRLPISGWLVRFDKLLLRRFLLEHPTEEILYVGEYSRNKPLITLSRETRLRLDALAHLLEAELTLTAGEVVVQNYLKIILLHVGLAFRDGLGISGAEKIDLVILELKGLIDQFFIEQRSPAFYAAKLGLSVRKLNEVCGGQTGCTVVELLAEKVQAEAERLLGATALLLKEIAYELNFTSPAYFTRFFKKHRGVHPSEFRRWLQKSESEKAKK